MIRGETILLFYLALLVLLLNTLWVATRKGIPSLYENKQGYLSAIQEPLIFVVIISLILLFGSFGAGFRGTLKKSRKRNLIIGAAITLLPLGFLIYKTIILLQDTAVTTIEIVELEIGLLGFVIVFLLFVAMMRGLWKEEMRSANV